LNKAEKEHMRRVAELGCIICGQPAELHHINNSTMGKRSSNYEVIPLCHIHHRNGGFGIAIHAGLRTWQENHGYEKDLLEEVKKRLELL